MYLSEVPHLDELGAPGTEAPDGQVVLEERIHERRPTVAHLDGELGHLGVDRVEVPGPGRVVIPHALPLMEQSIGDIGRAGSVPQVEDLLDRGLRELPAAYRVVFVLRDIEGLSTQETASILKLGESAVKSRAVRARLALRKFLSPYLNPREPRRSRA